MLHREDISKQYATLVFPYSTCDMGKIGDGDMPHWNFLKLTCDMGYPLRGSRSLLGATLLV